MIDNWTAQAADPAPRRATAADPHWEQATAEAIPSQSSALGSRPAIRVRGLVKRYGPITAVDGIDLEIATGQTIALLGPRWPAP